MTLTQSNFVVELWSELEMVQQVAGGVMLIKLRSVMIDSALPFHVLKVIRVQHLQSETDYTNVQVGALQKVVYTSCYKAVSCR